MARILIIDDEENIRSTMTFALEAVGHQVETAADGPEGLRRFGPGPQWDLVLLDQRMPGMDGLEVLKAVRERDPAARVVMVTAYGTIELAVDAMKAGAVDFLRKPFNPKTLRGAVDAALRHPKAAVETLDLEPLLSRSTGPDGVPQIHFRTLNGFCFWPVSLPPDAGETDALRIRRGYEVLSPDGERRHVAVDISIAVRGSVTDYTQEDFPADSAIWGMLCKSALSHYLWERAALPPENLMVYVLTRDQLELVRKMAGVHKGRV